jgi:hypothetical protein
MLMSFRTDKVSRRQFSLGLLAAPIGAALGSGNSAAEGRSDESAEAEKWIADTAAPPFGLTETFRRSVLATPMSPFGLEEVRLHDGPLKQSTEWNRSYPPRPLL